MPSAVSRLTFTIRHSLQSEPASNAPGRSHQFRGTIDRSLHGGYRSEPMATIAVPSEGDPRVFYDRDGVTLVHGDCLDALEGMEPETFDMVFVAPPYMLSNDGVTCHAGQMVSVNKGEWDRSQGVEADHEFVLDWLSACRRVMKPDATIWVSGTQHIIHSVGFALQKTGFRILNDITWYKVNPPPNLCCRYFTHATETIIWAARSARSRYTFDYRAMKALPNPPFDVAGKQMKSVWAIVWPIHLCGLREEHRHLNGVRGNAEVRGLGSGAGPTRRLRGPRSGRHRAHLYQHQRVETRV